MTGRLHIFTDLSWLAQHLNKVDVAFTTRITLASDRRKPKHPLFWIAHVGAHLGDSLLWLVVTAVLWKRRVEPAQRHQLLAWLFSLLATLGGTLAMKQLFQRRRPGDGRFLYGVGADVHSFPSGHGARTGVILVWASVLHPLLGKLAPLLVLWISWSRVALGIHYMGDLLVGFLLGVSISKLVKKLWH